MNGQRGSILIGVLILTLAMAIAVNGLILSASNNSLIEEDSMRDLKMHYAAETGMQIGVRWSRAYDENLINDSLWPTAEPNFTITNGTDGFATIHGMKVKVVFGRDPSLVGRHLIRVWAKDGINKGVLETTWQISTASEKEVPPIHSDPNLKTWKEIYHPDDY